MAKYKGNLVTPFDIKLYQGIIKNIKNQKLSQKALCEKEKINEQCLSRRLPKLISLGLIEKKKVDGKNENRISIKNGLLPKIKNLVALFENKI